MIIIARTTECPKEWTQKRLRAMFPQAEVVGSPYGWWFYVEQTNVVWVNYGWKDLVKEVYHHLKGNGVTPPGNLELQMMTAYCLNTGSNVCAEDDSDAPDRESFMRQTSRFLGALEDAATHGLVSQEEAERRAEICSRCPFNLPEKYGVCWGCAAKNAAAKVAKFAFGKATSLDDKLLTCHVCHCRLPLKVWVRKEAMDHTDLKDKWWEECWMREG